MFRCSLLLLVATAAIASAYDQAAIDRLLTDLETVIPLELDSKYISNAMCIMNSVNKYAHKDWPSDNDIARVIVHFMKTCGTYGYNLMENIKRTSNQDNIQQKFKRMCDDTITLSCKKVRKVLDHQSYNGQYLFIDWTDWLINRKYKSEAVNLGKNLKICYDIGGRNDLCAKASLKETINAK